MVETEMVLQELRGRGLSIGAPGWRRVDLSARGGNNLFAFAPCCYSDGSLNAGRTRTDTKEGLVVRHASVRSRQDRGTTG